MLTEKRLNSLAQRVSPHPPQGYCRTTFRLLLCLCLALISGSLHGQTPRATSDTRSDEQKQQEALDKFKGAGFGAGISLTVIPSSGAGVKTAEVVNGIVRVTEVQHSNPRIILETHYFFVNESARFLKLVDPKKWGWGPFLGVQMGSDQIVQALGAGVMVGFRRALDKADSFNVGAGGVYDTAVKTLGSGIREDQPLPTGETTVRFKTDGRWGWLFVFSFGF